MKQKQWRWTSLEVSLEPSANEVEIVVDRTVVCIGVSRLRHMAAPVLF
jgi:hypothetical protein